jgi:PAS domain S-box-containing protein
MSSMEVGHSSSIGSGGGGDTYFDETQMENSSCSDLQFNASLDALLSSDGMDDSNPMTSSDGISNPYHASTHEEGGAWTTQSSNKASPPPQGLLTAESTGTWPGDTMTAPSLNFYASPPVSSATQSSMYHYSGPFVIPYAPDMTHHHVLPSNSSGQHCQDPSINVMASFSSGGPSMTTLPAMMGSSAIPPEPVTSLSSSSSTLSNNNKRGITEVVSEDEGGVGGGKRRQDRNLREQQRSQKITQQIAELREVLAASNVPFKPDKYSTLVTVSDYIKDLQTKVTLLDAEHQRLIATISKTNEIVSNQYVPASATGENPPGGGSYCGTDAHANGGGGGAAPSETGMVPEETSDETMLVVGGIDYRCIFSKCGVALAVASVDGRFLDCNHEFERLSGYQRGELLSTATGTGPSSSSEDHREADETKSEIHNNHKSLSLFNVLCREDMETVFVAMSAMLTRPPPTSQEEVEVNKLADTWSGTVRFGRDLNNAVRTSVVIVSTILSYAFLSDCSNIVSFSDLRRFSRCE